MVLSAIHCDLLWCLYGRRHKFLINCYIRSCFMADTAPFCAFIIPLLWILLCFSLFYCSKWRQKLSGVDQPKTNESYKVVFYWCSSVSGFIIMLALIFALVFSNQEVKQCWLALIESAGIGKLMIKLEIIELQVAIFCIFNYVFPHQEQNTMRFYGIAISIYLIKTLKYKHQWSKL